MAITLLTDFGTADGYVAAVKGVILAAGATVPIVDVTHEIAPQDVEAGAYTLLTTYSFFPTGTVHVAVVDPGVGSERRGVVVEAGGHRFVGPDNGIFSHVLGRESGARTFGIAAEHLLRRPVSATFHGRDVFAPVAAALALGMPVEEVGPPIADPVRLPPIVCTRDASGGLRGTVIHVDRFGNLITSIPGGELAGFAAPGPEIRVADVTVGGIHRFYAEAERGRAFGIVGSAGFLEISVRDASAAERLGAGRGAEVRVVAPQG